MSDEDRLGRRDASRAVEPTTSGRGGIWLALLLLAVAVAIVWLVLI